MLRTVDKGRASLVSVHREGGDLTIPLLKEWARIDGIDAAIVDVTAQEVVDLAEEEINVLFSEQEVTAVYDSFAAETKLPFSPVVEIHSVKRLDKDEEHEVDFYRRGNYLYFDKVYGYEHPYYRQGLKVVYTAGHSELPKGLQLAIRQSFLTAYEDRQDQTIGTMTQRVYNNSRRKFLKYKVY